MEDAYEWTNLAPGEEPPELVVTPEIELSWLRTERNRRLAETDWTQGADVPEAIKLAYQPYRQALRDVTDNYTTLGDVVWPVEPA